MRYMNELSPEQARAAKRLRAIWDERKDRLGLTQERLSVQFGWETQSAVSQYLNGKIPLNLVAVLKFGGALEYPPQEIYPELFEGLPIKNIGRDGVDYSLALGVAETRGDYTYSLVKRILEKLEGGLDSHTISHGDLELIDAMLDRILKR